ncbi:MAG: uroporphyrinogen-III synthase [Paracoccaceae bacterium]
MHKTGPTLLLTRPEAQSQRFAQQFERRFGSGWPVVISPLIEIRLLPFDPLPEETGDLVFTSENAVLAFAEQCPAEGRRAWCVGSRTAEVAGAAGFVAMNGPGDVIGLIDFIKGDGGVRKLLYPHGRHRTLDIAPGLVSAGIETVSFIAYEQAEVAPTDDAVLLTSTDAPVLLPLFSPRSAGLAARAFGDARARFSVAALSTAVAEAFTRPSERLAIAGRPDAEAMLTALAQLIDAADMG